MHWPDDVRGSPMTTHVIKVSLSSIVSLLNTSLLKLNLSYTDGLHLLWP